MSLKGSAIIELTNADGSKHIVNHDNMITNAVNDLLKSKRGNMATIFNTMSNGESYAEALFGGILLFGDTLDESADKYSIPTTNIIGYASQEAYNGLDVARGSFNQAESGLQDDGSYKFVWDFATSQANGSIKSLSLCPKIMGQIGASDTAVKSERRGITTASKASIAPFNNNGRIYTKDIDGISSYRIIPVAVIGDIMYAIDMYNILYNSSDSSAFFINNGNVLKLYKFRIGQDSISIKDVCCMATYIETVDVALPDEFISALRTSDCPITFWFDSAKKSLIVFPCSKKSNIEVNGTTKYIEIALENNMEITSYTFTNNTAGVISSGGDTIGYREKNKNTFFVLNDHIVCYAIVDGSNKMYVINRNDNTDVKEVKWAAGKEYKIETSDACYFDPISCRDNILIFARNEGNFSYPDWFTYILDMNTGIIKKTNLSNSGYQGVDIGDNSVDAVVDTYATYYLTINPFVVTTKNNLDTVISKTSSQTMKITYTLTESEGA